MSYQRGSNQAPAPAIRAGLSVQELKAMTAMRMATSNEPQRGYASNVSQKIPSVNPASSYQTATPQQLQAAGIQPIVVNERQQMKARLQKQNSQPLLGGGLNQFEDTNYYNRGSTLSDRSHAVQQQPPALSAYHQQLLASSSKYPAALNQTSKELTASHGIYSNGEGLSPILRAPMQQQNLYQQSRAEVLQNSSSTNYGRVGSSSISGLRKDSIELPQHGKFSLQPQQLSQAEEDDLLYIQNMGSATYGRNVAARPLPAVAGGRGGLSQMGQYSSELLMPQQGRLQPVHAPPSLQAQQQLRSVGMTRNAPLRPLQQQYYAADDEGDDASQEFGGLLGSSYGQQQSRLGSGISSGTGYQLSSNLLHRENNIGGDSALFGPTARRTSGLNAGLFSAHQQQQPEHNDLDGNGEEDNSGASSDFHFSAAIQRESGAFSDSFSELNLLDQQDQELSKQAALGTRPVKLGSILKSQSQPTIPLNSQTFSAYQGYTAAAALSSPISGSMSPMPAMVSSRHATMAVQGLLLPEVGSASPHTSRENTPKTSGAGSRPSPQTLLGGGSFYASEPVTSPGQFLPQLGKSKSGRNLLGPSPVASPALFPRKSSLLTVGGGLEDAGGDDGYFSSELAESVLMGALGGTPQPTGKSFNFSKDVNEFRAQNGGPRDLLLPGFASEMQNQKQQQQLWSDDLDRSLFATKNATCDLHHAARSNNEEAEEEDGGDGYLRMAAVGALSRDSSGSQGYSNAVSPRGRFSD